MLDNSSCCGICRRTHCHNRSFRFLIFSGTGSPMFNLNIETLILVAVRFLYKAIFMVYIFVSLILGCIMLFIGGWVFVWVMTKEPPLPIMIQFIAAITSVSFVAAIGFFGRALIDGDDNGIPDEFEKGDETHEKRH